MIGGGLHNPTRRVRVLNGPLRGATHPVGERLGIGRASSSDIQLVHDGISRQHAQIVTDEHGRHVLVDLDSSNGTFIEGHRIRRHVLTPGTTFKIMRVKLVYEELVEESVPWADSGVFAIRRIDRETLRGTIDYGALDLPQPAAPRVPLADDTEPIRLTPDVPDAPDAPDAVVPRDDARPPSAPSAQARGEERHRVVATRKDGTIYEGSLVDDIVEYRELRMRQHRGDAIRPQEREAFEALELRLRAPDPEDQPPARRDFNRFLCHFPAKLRFASGNEMSAAVLDLGVDGTRLRVYGHQIEHDEIVWLAIHLVTRGRARTVVFTGRVAWTCRDHLGLGFAGAPGWEHQGGHRKIAVRTHMDLDKQLRAARATLGRVAVRSRRPSS